MSVYRSAALLGVPVEILIFLGEIDLNRVLLRWIEA
jgi:hypothetical protein